VNLDYTQEDIELRASARSWLAENVPREKRPAGGSSARVFDLEWQRTLYDAGWAGISWPKEYGGRGLSLTQQLIWHEEYARAGGPFEGACFVGLNHAGPTLIACASDEQKAFHLPKILRGEVAWCQGFSEPNAGSDLASLECRAEVVGDELVVNGQKIWTSFADVADYQEMLVRTDPGASRHGGITWVICDMRAPGIEIRPIPTMTGVADFSEVFYTDVRIPLGNVVGRINDGWSVTRSTLGFERGTALMALQMELSQVVEDLIELAREVPGPAGGRSLADGEIQRRLAVARAEVAALRAMTLAGISRAQRSPVPGPEGSMVKLFYSELTQRVSRLALDILGPGKLERTGARLDWVFRYLDLFSATIAGGTSEIQREIIGDRVLGLPRDRHW